MTRSRSLEEACDRLACLPSQLAKTTLPVPASGTSAPTTPSVAVLHSAVESIVDPSSPYLQEAEISASEPERLHYLGRALEVRGASESYHLPRAQEKGGVRGVAVLFPHPGVGAIYQGSDLVGRIVCAPACVARARSRKREESASARYQGRACGRPPRRRPPRSRSEPATKVELCSLCVKWSENGCGQGGFQGAGASRKAEKRRGPTGLSDPRSTSSRPVS